MKRIKIAHFTFLALFALIAINFTTSSSDNISLNNEMLADSTKPNGQQGIDENLPVETNPNEVKPPEISDTTHVIIQGKPPADQEPDTSKVREAPEPIKVEEEH
jgi:hypothetical protein